MNPEKAFAQRLLTNAGVAALLGDRIYPNTAPEQVIGSKQAYAVYDRISTVPLSLTHNGTSTLRQVRMQIDVYAASHDLARNAANAVIAALDVQQWVQDVTTVQLCLLDNDQSNYLPDAKLHRAALDFILTCSPTE